MKDPLLLLAPSELRALAESMRTGRLPAPFAVSNLRRIIGNYDVKQVSTRLTILGAEMSLEGLAACLEFTANAVGSRPVIEDAIDLVTTGPEVGGVANRTTAVVVSELFRNAERSVLVAGYAVYQGQRVFKALAQQMAQNADLQVRMFLDVPRKQGDTTSSSDRIARFINEFRRSKWPVGMGLPAIYCCEEPIQNQDGKVGSLHAKSIVVDNAQVFVSSANFTEAAQERNIEIGLLIKSAVLAERIGRFFGALVDNNFFVRAC